MNVQVLYFAFLKDQAALSSELIEGVEPGSTVLDLFELLRGRHPSLRLDGVRAAIDEDFVATNTILKSGDLVALIPPVSGG